LVGVRRFVIRGKGVEGGRDGGEKWTSVRFAPVSWWVCGGRGGGCRCVL